MASVDTLSRHADDITLRDAVVTDLTALRTAITTLTAQLDADAWVTDTDYAANCDPAALTTTT